MIRTLKGKIIFSDESYIILETSSGIGYRIFTTNTFSFESNSTNTESFFYIHTSVRETSINLYGFKTISELNFFELLISVSGVGPKAGINILSNSSPSLIKQSIISGDTFELTKASGIGKKIAEKIILELKNKINKIKLDSIDDVTNNFDIEIYDTLENMGFTKNQIRNTLENLPKKKLSTEEKIKESLKLLAKKNI